MPPNASEPGSGNRNTTSPNIEYSGIAMRKVDSSTAAATSADMNADLARYLSTGSGICAFRSAVVRSAYELRRSAKYMPSLRMVDVYVYKVTFPHVIVVTDHIYMLALRMKPRSWTRSCEAQYQILPPLNYHISKPPQ